MNYIEFEIGGKLRGFKAGLGFFGDVLDHLKLELHEFGTMLVKNPFKAMPAMLFFMHLHDCNRKGFSTDFTIDDFEDWIEELPSGVSNKNLEKTAVMVIQNATKHLPKDEEVDSKKK